MINFLNKSSCPSLSAISNPKDRPRGDSWFHRSWLLFRKPERNENAKFPNLFWIRSNQIGLNEKNDCKFPNVIWQLFSCRANLKLYFIFMLWLYPDNHSLSWHFTRHWPARMTSQWQSRDCYQNKVIPTCCTLYHNFTISKDMSYE